LPRQTKGRVGCSTCCSARHNQLIDLLHSHFSQVLNPKQLTGSKVCRARQEEELADQHGCSARHNQLIDLPTLISAKFTIPKNSPAARFAAPDKRKSWLFNMAVQLGMAIGRYALPSFFTSSLQCASCK
jgi:hypothetical protein